MKSQKKNTETKEHYEYLIAKKQYENLIKPWYKKLDHWKVITWSVITFFSVAVLYKNGVFDFQTKTLQAERNALSSQKEYLEYAKKRLTDEKDSLQSITARLINQNRELELQGAQYQLINKRAFESLDAREKYFAKVMARNVELERNEQAMIENKKKSESLSLSLAYPMNNGINSPHIGTWNTVSDGYVSYVRGSTDLLSNYTQVPSTITGNYSSLGGFIKSDAANGSLDDYFSKYSPPITGSGLLQLDNSKNGLNSGLINPNSNGIRITNDWNSKEINIKPKQN